MWGLISHATDGITPNLHSGIFSQLCSNIELHIVLLRVEAQLTQTDLYERLGPGYGGTQIMKLTGVRHVS